MHNLLPREGECPIHCPGRLSACFPAQGRKAHDLLPKEGESANILPRKGISINIFAQGTYKRERIAQGGRMHKKIS